MRQRVVKQAGASDVDPWNLKFVRGGLLDIEFIAQFLQLVHGADDGGVLSPNTCEALANCARLGLLDWDTADVLIGASTMYRNLTALFRVTVVGNLDPSKAPRGLANSVKKLTGTDNLAELETHLRESQARVYEKFLAIVESAANGGETKKLTYDRR